MNHKDLYQKALRLRASEREGSFAYEVAGYALTRLHRELIQIQGLHNAMALTREWEQNTKPDNIAIRWYVVDVVSEAKHSDLPVPSDPFATLKNLRYNHDPAVGINWDVIRTTLENQ
jgi:hypothetical protein